ncbi:hypothetical protein BJL90_02245 [Clostridium formicaceticum]|nr:hypothetical protein BJL90_02245 [Clostridium formicaceticum]
MAESTKFPIALFNGTVATTNGLYKISDISTNEAKALIREHGHISAIGHEATAEVMSEILEAKIEMNRIQFQQEVGQKAIVLKLNVRPAEGVILSRQEIEAIGYCFKLMERLA